VDARLIVERLSVIIPTLNEARGIGVTLAALAPLRARGHELIVADGGSTDGTVRLAGPLCDRVVQGARGRALQMNAGARPRAATRCFSCTRTRGCPRLRKIWC